MIRILMIDSCCFIFIILTLTMVVCQTSIYILINQALERDILICFLCFSTSQTIEEYEREREREPLFSLVQQTDETEIR